MQLSRHGPVAIGNRSVGLVSHFALWDQSGQVLADITDIGGQIDGTNIGRTVKALVNARDSRDAAHGLLKSLREGSVLRCRGLQAQHARDELQAVVDPVIDLVDQHFVVLQRIVQTSLVALALDCHASMGRSLQKSDVMLAELSLRSAVNLQHPEGCSIALQNDVDGAAHAVSLQQIRGAEIVLRVPDGWK